MFDILLAPVRAVGRLRNKAKSVRDMARQSLFWTLLTRQRTWFRWTLALFFANFTVTLLITNLVADMVDQGIVAGAVPLRGYVVWILSLAVIQFGVGFAMRQGLMRLTYQVEFDLRMWLYTRIQSAELHHLDSVSSGQLVSRALTDLNTMESLLRLIPIIGGIVPILLGMTIYVAVLNPLMALVAFIPLPVNVWLVTRVRSRLWVLSFQELNERGELVTAIDEPVRGIRVVQTFGREDDARARVAGRALRVYRFALTRVRTLARADILMRFVPVAFQAAALLIGARVVGSGFLTLGEFLIAFQLIAQVMVFAQMFADVTSMWQYLRTAQARIGEVLALGRPPVTTGRALPPASTGLELRSVTVEVGGRAVLDAFDLAVRPGELLVLTGPPGSGKTTVAGAAAGMLPVEGGVVVLDGIPLADLEPNELSKVVRVVSEHPFLFATTARENLELAVVSGSADEDTLRRALRAAHAEDVLADLPDGLDSQIGDRGLTLSGGQRQRLALARALVAPPRVLVLDDALSAVNPSMEVEILRRIRAHAPDTAILCISRRSGPAAIADRVLTLPELADTDPVSTARREGLVEAMHAHTATSKVSEETPSVDEARVTDDAPPTLLGILWPFAVPIVIALVMLTLQTFLTRITPDLLFGNVADIIGNNDTDATDLRGYALFVIGAVGALCAYFFRISSQRFVQGLLYLLRRRTFARLTRLGIDYYDRETPGQVAARMVNDLDVIQRFLEGQAFAFMVYGAQMLMGIVALFILSPSVTLVVLLFALLITAITAVQLPVSMRAYNRARTEVGRVTSMFEEDFNGRHEIRGFGATARQMRRFTLACWELRSARRWATGVANFYTELVNVIGTAMSVVVLFRSGNLVLAGSLSVGTALTVQLMAKSATLPLPIMASTYTESLEAQVSWRRLRQPFFEPILPEQRPAAVPCEQLRGEVVFDKVAFSYPHTGRAVLHEVSFSVPAGASAAIVGYTGAGKSSIAKLLSRVYDPDHGAVRVDGLDLRDLDLHDYRSRIGVVPQDSFVFTGTVASNIAYGCPDASREQIEAAARAVGAHETLAALEDGYDHPVTEEGANLTAAQRQLIALARSCLVGPDILVLDEATSSLDAGLERKVLDAMSQLDCTMVMITHRETVVDYADLVIVLDAGRVVEMGPRAELVGAGGVYDHLWATEPSEDAALVGVGAPAAQSNGAARPRRRRTSRREAQ